VLSSEIKGLGLATELYLVQILIMNGFKPPCYTNAFTAYEWTT